MYCSHCGAQNPEGASFCSNCGSRLPSQQPAQPPSATAPQPGVDQSQAHPAPLRELRRALANLVEPRVGQPQARPAPATGELASYAQRAGSFLIDAVLEAIPYVGLVPLIINLVMYRRGSTIGLRIASARIIRENGDVSGFYHTAVRAAASALSLIPFGLGYWWAFWDPKRQTWHDKLLHTYVLRDTAELEKTKGSSSAAAVVLFWLLWVVLPLLLIVLFFFAVFVAVLNNSFR